MQVFLEKAFKKDIAAITQNITFLIMRRLRLERYIARFFFGNLLSIPIIVYQPGKVGSRTVLYSLTKAFEKIGLSTPVYHAHNLNYIESIEESVKQSRKAPVLSLEQLAESKTIRQQIDADQSKKWNIVSLVRDPVAIRVSTMFQLLGEYIPDWAELAKEDKLSIQDLQHLLLTREEFDPGYLSAWFNLQVRDLFNFDVFSVPFDIANGYQIYRLPMSRFSFMIIRLEDLNQVARSAFNKFIGLQGLELVNRNMGDEKPYRELYRRFKSTPLPAEYLDIAYKSQYARHFYAQSELDAFRNRWLHPEHKSDDKTDG